MMKRACPSLLWFFGRSPVCVRARPNAGEYVAPLVAVRRGHQPPRTSSKEMRSVGYYGACTSRSLQSTVATSRVANQTVPLWLGTHVVWVTSPTTEGCTRTSAVHAWRTPRLAYSTGVVVQKPVPANNGDDRQQHGQPVSVAQTSTAEGHNAASRHAYTFNTDARSLEGSGASTAAPAQRPVIDRMHSAEYGAVHPGWSTGSALHRESFHGGQPPHGHGYPPYMSQYDMQPTQHVSSPYSAYESPEGPSSSGSTYQYSGLPAEGFAPTYNAHWNGVPSPGGYMDNSAVQPSPPQYMGSEGAAEQLVSSHPHAFGGAPQPYNNMPMPQHELHPHMYPVAPGHTGTAPSLTPPVNNLPPPELFSPSPGVPLRNALPTDPASTRGGSETHYSRNSLDSSGVGGSASESFLGTRLRGHLSGGGTGEERLEQLLVEIRQRLGNRANTYDAALEQDPRALLQLACRPESLRRMQHSSLDWWYVLFRWQDRYHAMQLSGEIRRRNAAAAAAAVSSSDAAATGTTSGSRSPSPEGVRGPGHERGGLFSFFSPEDEEVFFVFLQKLQQAFAARPLSEEAQTHGRLHDRMRCIRQLARAVSDDHRALGMGAAARKEADSLLWSLALQEARCAANGIDILRTKGGMPMLLSILRLAETADRRRRRSATRVLVPLSDGRQDVNRKSTSQTEIHKRQDDVIVQNFTGGRELKWEWISADETQQVFDKLADAFLSCAQEANIEPCVHAVVGMGTLAEKSFLHEAKWQKVCQAMTERLKLSEMVSAGAEAGLLLDSLTWMFVRNANASRRCRHVIFQVNFLLGQILRECVYSLFLGEENLLFYTSVLLKRQLRSDEPRKTLTPRAFCNLLVANAIAGVSASTLTMTIRGSCEQHLGVVVKYLLNTMVTHDRAKNLSLEETARLAWAICALQLYDPAVAGSQWPAKEAAELLGRLLSRIGRLVDGPQAAYILEALRDSHDCVAPLYPDMGFTDKYADQEIRLKACSAYDQSHLGLGGTIITVVRGALRSFGGTVKPGPERRSLLTRLRNGTGTSEESDTASDAADRRLHENSELEETTTPQIGESVADEVSGLSSTAGGVEFSTAKSAKDKECSDVTAGAREDSEEDSRREKGNTMQGAREEVQGDSVVEGHAQTAQATVSSPSESESTSAGPNVPVSTESLRKAEWIEGAVLDGYPVSFYSPDLKVALDVDVCSKLPSKYMKRRHMDSHLRRNGIRHVVFCADLKRPQEPLYTLLERVLKDETGTLGKVGLHPTKVRAYLRTDRNSRSMRTDEAE